MNGTHAMLPTEQQQRAVENDAVTFPELTVPVPVPPSTRSMCGHPDRAAPSPSDNTPPDRCRTAQCHFPAGHAGPCSNEIVHQRFRDSVVSQRRDSSNICAAVEGDETGLITAAPLHAAYPVALVDDALLICYNTNLEAYGDIECPTKTSQALSGPHAAEWKAAYARDLEAKLKNGTFALVPRPVGKKVLPTKVHHAIKRDPATNVITELRARWVGCGYAQGAGDFKETYTATPTATSIRIFLVQTLALGLSLFQGDVTKAFTLNPIDVETYCEQMPGMEQPGPEGTSKENTVCLLYKCLEGLKQAGNVWQTTHTQAMLAFELHSTRFKQSVTEPTLFTLHCSRGILFVLVWIDDLLIGCSLSLG